MTKFLLASTLLLLSSPFFAQNLPYSDPELRGKSFNEVCAVLDAWFEEEFRPDNECPDNEWVKYQRWKWFWRDRVTPEGRMPDMKTQWDAFRQAQATLGSQRSNNPQWEHEGPTENPNSGYWGMGRTKHIAFHPTDSNLFYLGTPDGGIWRTTDGGQNWQALGDQLPYLPVGVILIDYQHPDTLYISLGDKIGWWQYNLGVYKSTDGGLSWNPSGLSWELAQGKVIYALEMSPTDPQTLVAATNDGLLRTSDGGVNWTTLLSGEFTDVKFRPGDPNTLYAARHDYWGASQALRSTDGGANWTQTTNFDFPYNDIRLAVTIANPDWVGLRCSNGKRFYRSTDAGATYTFRSEMPEDFIFSFSQTDTNLVYSSNVVVHASHDGGLTWNAITHWYDDGIHPEVHADVHHIGYNPHNPSELFFCNDGGVYKYEEPSGQWTDLSNGLGIAQFYRVAVSEYGPLRLAAGSQDNGGWLRKPDNTWKHTNGGDAMVQAIDPVNGYILYTEYYGGNAIYRSFDGFETYSTISDNLPDDPSGDWVTPFILNPINRKTLLFGFHDVYRTFDRGNTFHKISDNLTGDVNNKLRDIAYAPSDTNIIVASWQNKLYRTLNGGQYWSAQTLPGNEDITRIAIHPADPNRIWVCKSGYSDHKKVYRSTTGGQPWVNISGELPNVPLNCILYDSLTNYLFVGTDIGVYFTDADQIDWQPFGTGLPNVYVFDLKIRQSTRRLYAGTHGRGVYSASLENLVSGAGNQALQVTPAVRVYPNPTGSSLFWEVEQAGNFIGMASLFDLTGRLVRQTGFTGVSSFEVSNLPNGLYLLHLTGPDGQTIVYRKVEIAR